MRPFFGGRSIYLSIYLSISLSLYLSICWPEVGWAYRVIAQVRVRKGKCRSRVLAGWHGLGLLRDVSHAQPPRASGGFAGVTTFKFLGSLCL